MNFEKAERAASKGLRFFFAPQIGGGLKHVRGLFASLIQTLAMMLAKTKLLPPTHRSLNPASFNDIRLGEILVDAWTALRAPGKHRADQYAVFGAVAGLIILSVAAMTTLVGHLLVGTAHAQLTPWLAAPAACSGASTSLFTTACTDDMAQQWIDMLLLGDTTSWFASRISSLPLAQGLAALFGTYSVGMLVLAGFLVLYHLLAIIAETAHEGRVGGKGMNQIWAPLRLVMAVGLLIPLGAAGSGLNSGQYIVVQVAKWGSALASNGWLNFATGFANQMGAYTIMPPLPPVSGVLKDLLKIKVCEKIATIIRTGPPPAAPLDGTWPTVTMGAWTPSDATNPNLAKEWFLPWDANTTLTTGGLNWSGVCGQVRIANPRYVPTGDSMNFFSAGNGVDSGDTFRQTVLIGHVAAITNAAAPATAGTLDALAGKIANSVDQNQQYILTVGDLLDFVNAVLEYRNNLRTIIVAGLGGGSSAANQSTQFVNDAAARGWVSAATWFNSIARINGMIIDATSSMPRVILPTPPNGIDSDSRILLGRGMYAVDAALQDYVTYMATAATPVAAPENGFADVLGVKVSVGGNNGLLDRYLSLMGQDWNTLLGVTSGNLQDINASPGAYAATYRLNTANPLAELSALGYRIMNLAINTSQKANQCASSSAASNAAREKAARAGVTIPASTESQADCGNEEGSSTASFLISTITTSLIGAGMTLAFVLPLLPFIRFMFGLITWLVSLLEAVVAIPLVALAHIKTDGEGIGGPMARNAYMLLLQIFARPILMIFGLILALLVFNLMIVALNELYSGAIRSIENGDKISALSGVIYTIIYASLAYGFANAAFKMIDLIPNQALNWIGGQNVSGIDESYRVGQSIGQVGGQASYANSQLNSGRSGGYLEQIGAQKVMGGGGGGSAPR